jgi:hypothetical protein
VDHPPRDHAEHRQHGEHGEQLDGDEPADGIVHVVEREPGDGDRPSRAFLAGEEPVAGVRALAADGDRVAVLERGDVVFVDDGRRRVVAEVG